MNTIEAIRLKVGLTKPQMMRLLESNPGNVELKPAQALTLFTMQDEDIATRAERRSPGSESSLIIKAKVVESLYDIWLVEVKSRLESINTYSQGGLLRTRDVARVLGISDFHLSQLRIRGQIKAHRESNRRYGYKLKDILDFVDRNSKTVTSTSHKTRGPLTNAFLSWMSEQEEGRELLTATA